MKIHIREGNNRILYKNAKKAFKENKGWIRGIDELSDFWDLLGKANNMKVIIREWQGPYPVIDELEFNSEADYAWFVLRYS